MVAVQDDGKLKGDQRDGPRHVEQRALHLHVEVAPRALLHVGERGDAAVAVDVGQTRERVGGLLLQHVRLRVNAGDPTHPVPTRPGRFGGHEQRA